MAGSYLPYWDESASPWAGEASTLSYSLLAAVPVDGAGVTFFLGSFFLKSTCWRGVESLLYSSVIHIGTLRKEKEINEVRDCNEISVDSSWKQTVQDIPSSSLFFSHIN